MAPLLLRGGRVVDPAAGLDGVMDVLIKVFKSGGECQTINLAPLGLTMPAWVLAFAVVMLAGGVYANLKLKR